MYRLHRWRGGSWGGAGHRGGWRWDRRSTGLPGWAPLRLSSNPFFHGCRWAGLDRDEPELQINNGDNLCASLVMFAPWREKPFRLHTRCNAKNDEPSHNKNWRGAKGGVNAPYLNHHGEFKRHYSPGTKLSYCAGPSHGSVLHCTMSVPIHRHRESTSTPSGEN